MKIKKILEFYARIMRIIKILEFHSIIMKITKIKEFIEKNNENHENPNIIYENYEKNVNH